LTDLSQVELVTLAVYLADGAQRAVDTEDIAVKAFELAPERFAWRKYPQHINLELVRVYLSEAKTGKEALVAGSGKTGWSLTQRGLEWARSVEPRLHAVNFRRARQDSRSGSIDENRWRRERARVCGHPAWHRWVSGDQSITTKEAAEIFRIDTYSIGQIRESKITRLLDLFAEDAEVAPFLTHASAALRETTT
jgi:hypothetical protein